jgi:hypothetical protein
MRPDYDPRFGDITEGSGSGPYNARSKENDFGNEKSENAFLRQGSAMYDNRI